MGRSHDLRTGITTRRFHIADEQWPRNRVSFIANEIVELTRGVACEVTRSFWRQLLV